MAQDYLDQYSYSTQLLNTIFDSMMEGVIVYNHEGKICSYNSATLRILGLSEENLFGSWLEKKTVNSDMTPLTFEYYPSIIPRQTGKPLVDTVYGIFQEDGSLKWISVNAVPVFDGKRNVSQVVVTFIDITMEKKYKESLIDTQNKLDRINSFLTNLLDSLPSLVCYVDKNLVYKYANHTYLNFLKMKSEDIVGKRLPDVLGPKVYENLKPYLKKVFNGEPQSFKNKLHFLGVGERSTNVTMKPDTDSTGVKGYFAVIDDITEYVRMMDVIQQKEEEQSKILDSINTYLGHWSKDLINIHANRAYEEFFNKSPGSIKGMHIKDLYGPKLYEESKPYIDKVLKGESHTYEREVIDHRGNKVFLMVTYLPEITRGEIVGYFIVGNDVTKLKASEEKFKKVLELAPNPTIILNDNGNIEMVNNQTIVQFGYSSEELIGKSFKQLLPHRFHNEGDKLLQAFLMAPSIKTIGRKFNLWARRKDGSEFPFEVSVGPLQSNGHILFKCVIQDISERLQQAREREELLEKEFKARLEAEDAIAKRDEMLAIVSHDLRNPLAIIVGNIELLIKKRPHDLELIAKLEKMKQYSNLMLNMIKDLLDIYKMEEGKFDIESGIAIYEPNTIVKDICAAQKILVNESGLTLEMDLETDLPALTLDLNLFNRVFQNLIGNSLKFTPPGGIIKVNAKKTQNYVIFSVQDNGPGIEKDILPIIFDRFAQAKKTSHLGAGLGLSICKAIIEAHGGDIWIETEIGVGSKFFFTIPIPKTYELRQMH